MSNSLYQDLVSRNAKLAVVGLGYVGMPIAVAFAKEINVIGFDINDHKIALYKEGKDITNEVGDDALKQTTVEFTSDANKLTEARFYIVAVPTPVRSDHTPDLEPVQSATCILGKHLSKNSIVVYESTVYPGVTEEICIPILERESGLRCGIDFKVGYSPERINPGDKVHRLDSIVKIVSGMDEDSLDEIANVYSIVVKAGVYRAESIRVAEAAKVIENSQRDINIAFMNELSIMFHKLGIDTQEVLKAAGTKWNFLPFYPGLVGGHCIGVDPYYLTYKAENMGYHSQIILSGRRINDDMGKFVAEAAVKNLIRAYIPVRNARVAILGITFKENCPDSRNSKVLDIYNELKEFQVNPIVIDPVADSEEVKRLYGLDLSDYDAMTEVDAVIIAVSHDCFKTIEKEKLSQAFKTANRKKIVMDLKGILDKKEYASGEYIYWRL